jgi:lipopolysaccharide heptosyltransferase II
VRILIVKIGAIGDAAMMLGAARALRERLDATITWVVGTAAADLVVASGVAAETIVVDERMLLKGTVGEKVLALASVWRKLFGQSYDLIAIGHRDWRYRLLAAVSSSRERTSFSRIGADCRWLPVPGRYHGNEYARLMASADGPGLPAVELGWLKVPCPDRLRSLLPRDSNVSLVAIAPGGARNLLRNDDLRRWPVERYVHLAKRLLQSGLSVALIGASSDAWVRQPFRHIPVLDLIGKTGVLDLLGVFGRCTAVVTHDSGPMHLAMLAGTPVVALFGPTNPAERIPLGQNAVVLWGGEQLPCRPCYDGKNYAQCRENACLQQISVDMVVGALNKLIDSSWTRLAPGRARRPVNSSLVNRAGQV